MGCFINRVNIPNRSLKGQRSDLPLSRKSDRKKEIYVVTHEQTIIYRQLFAGPLAGQWKGRKIGIEW